MKSTFKRLICVLLGVTIIAGLLPVGTGEASAKQSTFRKNGIVYAILGTSGDGWGEVSVIGVDEEADKGLVYDFTLPSMIYHKKVAYNVKKIESLAFACRSGIHRIIIEDGIEEIGAGAFYKCVDLEEIFITAKVSKIGSHCFGGCSNLKSVAVSNMNENYCSDGTVLYSSDKKTLISAPAVSGDYKVAKGVETIGGGAFDSNMNITSVTLPSSVKKIEEGAFYECKALTAVKLGSVETIGKEAFAGSGLVSITIPETTVSIEGNPFVFCISLTGIKVSKNNPKFKSSSGYLLNKSGKKLISGSAAGDDPTFPSSVKTVAEFAFAGNERIKKLTVPAGIKTINEGAFCYCTSLKRIRFESRNTKLPEITEDSYGVFFNTGYDLIAEVPYSENGFTEGSIETAVSSNSPSGVDITTF
ncbi:MAG: leucine-rich repeat domain-containing protein [Lachnospiraceae bacterium]|nr:leucine-rich repeat domain-containing protein [Lachnospiraceae bacterium]